MDKRPELLIVHIDRQNEEDTYLIRDECDNFYVGRHSLEFKSVSLTKLNLTPAPPSAFHPMVASLRAEQDKITIKWEGADY